MAWMRKRGYYYIINLGLRQYAVGLHVANQV